MKGILFNAEAVRAFLENRKFRTSRPIKPQPYFVSETAPDVDPYWRWDDIGPKGHYYGSGPFNPEEFSKYGSIQTGDILYVRETWQEVYETEYDHKSEFYFVNIKSLIPNIDEIPKTCVGLSTEYSCKLMEPRNKYYVYKASEIRYNDSENVLKWHPSIHMPKEAARLFFIITDVKVQNIKDVTEQDAVEDGFKYKGWVPTFNDPDNANGIDDCETPLDQFKTFWLNQYGTIQPWMWAYYLKPITKEQAEELERYKTK